MSSGGGTQTQYTQSPEQAAVYKALLPVIQKISGAALGTPATPGIPGIPTIPGAAGKPGIPGRPGVPGTPAIPPGGVWDVSAPPAAPALQDIPMYDIPSTQSIMPTQDWWGGISPEVKEGLWAPWNESAQQMMEIMGAEGTLGSARGGYAGTGERALGELYSRAGKDVGMQAWKMTAPGAMMGWGEELAQAKTPYQLTVGQKERDYANQMRQWGMEQESIQFPYKVLPGLMGGTYSQGVTTPEGGFNVGGAAMGAGAMGLGASMLANPITGLPLAGLMALGALGGGGK